MPSLSFPHTFIAKTKAKAAEVEANFQAIRTLLNTTKLDGDNLQDGIIGYTSLTTALKAILGISTSSTAPVVPKFAAARVYNSTSQALPVATWQAIPFDSERFDNDTIHDSASNNTRLTCKTAGLYSISGTVQFNEQFNASRGVALRLNGATFIASQVYAAAGSLGIDPTMQVQVATVHTHYKLAVNDYVELLAYDATVAGGNTIVVAGNYSPEFSMVNVGTG